MEKRGAPLSCLHQTCQTTCDIHHAPGGIFFFFSSPQGKSSSLVKPFISPAFLIKVLLCVYLQGSLSTPPSQTGGTFYPVVSSVSPVVWEVGWMEVWLHKGRRARQSPCRCFFVGGGENTGTQNTGSCLPARSLRSRPPARLPFVDTSAALISREKDTWEVRAGMNKGVSFFFLGGGGG